MINEEPVKTQCTGVGQVGGLGAGVRVRQGRDFPSLEEALGGSPDLEVSGRRGLRRGAGGAAPGVCRGLPRLISRSAAEAEQEGLAFVGQGPLAVKED